MTNNNITRWEKIHRDGDSIGAKLVEGDLVEGWHFWALGYVNEQGEHWCTRCQDYHSLPEMETDFAAMAEARTKSIIQAYEMQKMLEKPMSHIDTEKLEEQSTMTNEITEPTFSELRHEAQTTMRTLIKANQGLIEPEAVLHLGMFFGMLGKEIDQPMHLTTAQKNYYTTAHAVLNNLEYQAENYGDQRMVQLSNEDLTTLRNALAVLRGAR